MAAVVISAQSTGPVVVLIGPPGGGKTTQANFLRTAYAMPVIAAEDIVKENAAELNKRRHTGVAYADLREDPALTSFFRERLKTVDLTTGFVLDGYPATAYQAEDFSKLMTEMSLKRLLVLQLSMPDEDVRTRLAQSGESAERIEQRIKDYNREFGMIRTYYPSAQIVSVDGSGSPESVSKKIQAALTKAGIKPRK
jgi:adenylate kinase